MEYLSNNDLIDLVIITHTIDEHHECKKIFVEKFFPKARLFTVGFHQKKSDIVNQNNLNHYTTFIDDHLNNIYDFCINTNSVGKEFILPRFGYNDKLLDTEDKPLIPSELTELDLGMLEVMKEVECKIIYVSL